MRRLGPFLRPYAIRSAQAFGALAFVHLIEALAPLLLKLGVERIAAGDGALALPVGGIVALAALRYGSLSYGRRRNASISVDLAADLRITLFSHLQSQGAHFFSRYALGDLMARATNDVDAVRQFFRAAVNHIASISVVIVVAPIFMFFLSPKLTLVVVVLAVGLVTGAALLANAIRLQSAKVQAQFAALSEDIQRNLHGVRTIQAHAAETREIARFARSAEDYARANIALYRGMTSLGVFLTAAASASALIVAGVGGAQVLQGGISLGTLVAFIFYSGMILGVLGNFGAPAFMFLRASTACARLFQILDEAPEISDGGGPPRQKIAGAITVENLAFRYPEGALALKNLSFAIAPGELAAIHGRVGAGKTTLLRLLARRLEAPEGSIRIDGTDIRDFPLQQLRKEVAFVAQDSFLFAAPFSENISYDDPERAEDSIWGAAEAAALETTIRRAAQGLATPIGERGVTLSGGQKQRTVLARGLIREAPVLLLDDCFSALDAETEALIFAQIRRLRRGLTTIVVSHRVSTTQYADRVFMLEEGGVAESGPPEVLRARGGKYAELCARQGSRFAETGEIAQ